MTQPALATSSPSHQPDIHPPPPLSQLLASYIPGTDSYNKKVKLSSPSRLSVLYIASTLFLLLALLAHFLTSRDLRPHPIPSQADPPPIPQNLLQSLSPFGDSVYRQEAYYEQLEPGTLCRPKSIFSQDLPISQALTNMALEKEAKRVAAQFEYSSQDVNKAVKEFIREMEEGLEKQGTSLSQIPTYVTNVPNGTEKVPSQRCHPMLILPH